MTCIIRPAVAGDVDTVLYILTATQAESFPSLLNLHDGNVELWTYRWRRYIEQGGPGALGRPHSFIVLAERTDAHGTQAVGFAAYHEAQKYGADAELQAIFVLKDAQAQGVGEQLLRFVAEGLLADGIHSLRVGYDPANPYKRFYLKHGAIEIDPHWAIWRDIGVILNPPRSISTAAACPDCGR